MIIRPYIPSSDYPVMVELSLARNFPVIPREFLPSTGFIVANHCIGFLYKTDSSIAWLEWVVSNPKSEKSVRSEALDLLINRLIAEAKTLGFKAVFSSVSHPGLLERYKTLGFQVTDSNVTHVIKGI